MTDQNNQQPNFIPLPAVYITGASATATEGLMRLTVFEADGQMAHPRGCFVAADATWDAIIDLIKRQRELVAANRAANAANSSGSESRPN